MPFVFALESLPIHSCKRRKISHTSEMIRDPASPYKPPGYVDEATEKHQDGGHASAKEGSALGSGSDPNIRTSDREELIQCIKRGQRPTWVPKPGLEALCAETNAEYDNPDRIYRGGDNAFDPSKYDDEDNRIQLSTFSATDALRRTLSALHTGDFYDTTQHPQHLPPSPTTPGRERERELYQSEFSTPSPPWAQNLHSSSSPPSRQSCREPFRRSRAPSLGSSLSSSFVMRVPTSPLVHAMNNPSLDFSPRDISTTTTNKGARRRTMPPNAFDSFRMSPLEDAMSNFSHLSPETQSSHDVGTPPHRHKPRRSLSSFTYQPAVSPLAPFAARSRRPSFAVDVSPRQRASMVGSFEESILRGRMSTPASRPLDFVAQIGVVGKGNCAPSLKCPAHVTVPFPAVFYNYPSSHELRSISDDNPSPYVGTIDLEHNLAPAEHSARRSSRIKSTADAEQLGAEMTSPENTHIGRPLAREIKNKNKTPTSLKVPQGGVYRVPQAGQLQIIIKNPNKTAVKLFLVPYDLEGMLPGTKTFVRQRSFSSGPVLEAALSDNPATATAQDPAQGKDILRYLIHLKFCCTSKGRFYLYENIRVVFANRVPDDKEKLRNEVQLPDPRFSPYKPRAEGESQSPGTTEGTRRHSPDPTPPKVRCENIGTDSRPLYSQTLDRKAHLDLPPSDEAEHGLHVDGPNAPAIGDLAGEGARTVSPVPGFLPSTSSRNSPVPWSAPRVTHVVEAGDGLISRRLRELHGRSLEGNDR